MTAKEINIRIYKIKKELFNNNLVIGKEYN